MKAIEFAAGALAALLPREWRDSGTFVPIPSSTVRGEDGYDDRLTKVLTLEK